MTDSRIQPGTFVRHTTKGVGKVAEVGDMVAVVFWANRESGKTDKTATGLLTPLADDSPEALLWQRPEELAPWATERPLQLVALALSVSGGAGKVADICGRLDGRVPLGVTWDNWWKKRTKPMNNLPGHFEVVKAKGSNGYTLQSRVDAVPPDWAPPPKPKPATRADWERWLTADSDEPPPGRYPPKQVCDDLAKWPANDIDRVLACAIRGAERFLAPEKRPPKQAAASWMEAVAQARACQREYADSYSTGTLDERSGAVLRELARIAGRDKVLRVLADAFVAPEGYAAELEGLRQSLSDAYTRHAREMEGLRQSHTAGLEELRQSHKTEMEEQSKSHVAELEREQKEKENLRQRVETLRNQLFAGYEQSKLDIRQDMLVIVGELSQLVGKQDCVSESLLRDMRAGLSLALQAGGAKALGAVGGTTSFDPLKHQAAESVRIGDSVRITSPGIIVKGQRTSDRVLIKAQVSGISEKG